MLFKPWLIEVAVIAEPNPDLELCFLASQLACFVMSHIFKKVFPRGLDESYLKSPDWKIKFLKIINYMHTDTHTHTHFGHPLVAFVIERLLCASRQGVTLLYFICIILLNPHKNLMM